MAPKTCLIIAGGLAAVLLPFAATAQSWGGEYRDQHAPGSTYQPAYGQGESWRGRGGYDRGHDRGYGYGYGQGRRGGDFETGSYGFAGYPEFAAVKAHIRQELHEGREEGWLEGGQAWRFVSSLRDIERREAREFEAHGWSLPWNDRGALRDAFGRLDRRIDEVRDGG